MSAREALDHAAPSPEADAARDGPARGISLGVMEAATALFLGAIGGLAVWDSLRIGAGWGQDGPMAGYFPFWLGTGLILVSLGNLALAFRGGRGRRLFVSYAQLRHVASVLVPTAVYVALIQPFGIYLPSVALIVGFMVVLGRFGWLPSLATGLFVAGAFFLVFELWFLVPLPKGPVEYALGF